MVARVTASDAIGLVFMGGVRWVNEALGWFNAYVWAREAYQWES